jgi:hypothetical protein
MERDMVLVSLKDPHDSKIRVAYQLLVDNRHFSEKAASGGLKFDDGFFVPSPPVSTQVSARVSPVIILNLKKLGKIRSFGI